MAWVAPRTWVAGTVVLAAWMNEVRDSLKAIGDPWTAYTPTWTASGVNPTLGNGTITAASITAGKLTIIRIVLTFGSTTTAGTGVYAWTLPATALVAYQPIGMAVVRDVSVPANVPRVAYLPTTTTISCFTEAGAHIDNNTPYTWATGDTIKIQGTYEAA